MLSVRGWDQAEGLHRVAENFSEPLGAIDRKAIVGAAATEQKMWPVAPLSKHSRMSVVSSLKRTARRVTRQ